MTKAKECRRCSRIFTTKYPQARYCFKCRKIVNVERTKEWLNDPKNKEKVRKYYRHPMVKKRLKKWHKNHREKFGDTYAIKWRLSHPEKHGENIKKWILGRAGITPEKYTLMMKEQNGVCAICHSSNKSGRGLAVDHNHETKKIRGLLCSNCNLGIGYLKDDILRLEKAIEYLKRNDSK